MTSREDPTQANPVSTIEHVFGFENTAFREYLNSGHLKVNEYAELGGAMAQYDHPIVLLAAGWALAQAGINRYTKYHKPNQWQLEDRKTYIDDATDLWHEATLGLKEAQTSTDDDRMQAGYKGFELQAAHAMVHAPSMKIAAHWYTGHEVSEDDRRATITQVKNDLAELGGSLLKYQPPTREHQWTRNGQYPRTTLMLLLQDAAAKERLVLPAPFHKQHGGPSHRRADLLAISAVNKHCVTGIRVTTRERNDPHDTQVLFVSPKELDLAPGIFCSNTLRALIMRQRGLNLSRDTQYNLHRVSRRIENKIVENQRKGRASHRSTFTAS